MKIIDVVCSAGRTGFYFDDQRAIKQGAGHDGVFYVGTPVTEGFQSVRQAGESISVMLILEDGQIAMGDCAAVQYSGAGGRDPLFLAKDFIPVIDKYIKPQLDLPQTHFHSSTNLLPKIFHLFNTNLYKILKLWYNKNANKFNFEEKK